jgi:hypothetical protein
MDTGRNVLEDTDHQCGKEANWKFEDDQNAANQEIPLKAQKTFHRNPICSTIPSVRDTRRMIIGKAMDFHKILVDLVILGETGDKTVKNLPRMFAMKYMVTGSTPCPKETSKQCTHHGQQGKQEMNDG